MTTVSKRSGWEAYYSSGGPEFDVLGVSLTLDASSTVQVSGTITVAPTQAAIDLDPQNLPGNGLLSLRTDPVSGTIYFLVVRDVTRNLRDATVEFAVTSREVLLQDFTIDEDDATPREYADNLRDIVAYVITKAGAGAYSQPGDPIPIEPYWQIENKIMNPVLAFNADDWLAGTGASGLQRVVMSSPAPVVETAALEWTAGIGVSNVVPASAGAAYPVESGQWWTFSAYIASQAATSAHVGIQWWTYNGQIQKTDLSTTITSDPAEFRRMSVTAQAPPGAVYATPYIGTTGNPSGRKHYADAAMLYEGRELVPFFYGATPDDADYFYEFTGVSYVTTSIRRPVIDRPLDTFVWKAGQSAMEFLRPLLQASGYRLVAYVRNTGSWDLCDDDYRRSAGIPTVFTQGENLLDAHEKYGLSTDWCDAAAVTYRWNPGNYYTGRPMPERVEVDYYSSVPTPQRVKRLELTVPYPGPGRAENVVTRAQAKYRTIEITTSVDTRLVPDVPATVTVNGTTYTGVVASVRYGDEDRVTATITHLEETP